MYHFYIYMQLAKEGSMIVVSMKSFGDVLGTRAAGRIAYEKIMTKTDGLKTPALFDFEGVQTITNSFADEVFGRIAMDMGIEQMKRCTTFRNTNQLGARIIRRAIDSRASENIAATVQ